MEHEFDKEYWESHWRDTGELRDQREAAANPHLVAQTSDLTPGTALEAGCGEGAEAICLAAQGWQVTAADISAEALSRAAERARSVPGEAGEPIQWVEADLSDWQPDRQFDLVTTHYAHPAMPQLDFYRRIADWVAPGGTLLIVGHLLSPGAAGHGHGHGHGHQDDGQRPPDKASATAASIVAGLDTNRWDVVTADEASRTVAGLEREPVELYDVVVRALRRVESAS
jgi:SAM-dependent methyltransferase